MKPFEILDATVAPNGARLTLHRRGPDLFIHLDGEELMSTRSFESEAALAELAVKELAGHQHPRVLIGGLGLGFTLRSALALLPARAAVTVADLLPVVIEWNRQYLPASRAALDDRRVTVVAQDVAAVLADAWGSKFDAILLDIDDGPSSVCFESNLGLYSRQGLELSKGRLEAGGVLAIWSAQSDPPFAKLMRKSGFAVRVASVRGHRRKGARYSVFLGRKEGAPEGGRRRGGPQGRRKGKKGR